MSELLKRITPKTIGIMWFCKDEKNLLPSLYSEVDYILNGLLTASLREHPVLNSRLIVGENFGRPFFVLISSQPSASDIDGFLTLVKKNLREETDVVLIDEVDAMTKLERELRDILPSLRLYSTH